MLKSLSPWIFGAALILAPFAVHAAARGLDAANGCSQCEKSKCKCGDSCKCGQNCKCGQGAHTTHD